MPPIESLVEGRNTIVAGTSWKQKQPVRRTLLLARVHTWDISIEVDSSGHYVLKNHTLVTFRFSDIRELCG